jgi:hypothetical protein
MYQTGIPFLIILIIAQKAILNDNHAANIVLLFLELELSFTLRIRSAIGLLVISSTGSLYFLS